MVTVGGVESRLLTVTVTRAEVAALPAASWAMAASRWVPLGTSVVGQTTVYGGTLTSAPTSAPSTSNCTPPTPTLPEALADTATLPATVPPAVGAVLDSPAGATSGRAAQAP